MAREKAGKPGAGGVAEGKGRECVKNGIKIPNAAARRLNGVPRLKTHGP